MNIFHFLTPFSINLISAFFIIIKMYRQRSTVRKNQTYCQQLCKEFDKSKHLFISSCMLVVLALPRLIISFVSGCMRSTRNPWLFLTGYFVSFVPPLMIFVVFVLPSTVYKKEFDKMVVHRFRALIQYRSRHP